MTQIYVATMVAVFLYFLIGRDSNSTSLIRYVKQRVIHSLTTRLVSVLLLLLLELLLLLLPAC